MGRAERRLLPLCLLDHIKFSQKAGFGADRQRGTEHAGKAMSHIERKSELRRRRTRRAKLRKLRDKLAKAKTSQEAEAILSKIRRISPFWQPPATS